MTASAYDLAVQARDLLDRVQRALDDDPDADLDALCGAEWAALQGEAAEKIDALAAVYRRALAEAEWLEAEANRLTARARALRATSERVRGYATTLVEAVEAATGEAKISGRTASARLQRNPPALRGGDDPATWPEWAIRTKRELDRAAVKAALVSGSEVTGFTLESSRSLRWGGGR